MTALLSAMRIVFWGAATICGAGGVVFLAASFREPMFGGSAIASILIACACLYAREETNP